MKTINLKPSNRGIGVDFYSKNDEQKFIKLKSHLSRYNADPKRIEWDIDNLKLKHPSKKAGMILDNVKLNLKSPNIL